MNLSDEHVGNIKNRLNVSKILKFWMTIICLVFVATALVWFWISHCVFCYTVQSGSMENTLFKGDYVIAPRGQCVGRGTIIFFKYHGDPSRICVRRVIGAPHDIVNISGNNITVSGWHLGESYVKGAMKVKVSCAWAVPDGKCFALSDNRSVYTNLRSLDDSYVDVKDIVASGGYAFSMNGAKSLE